MTAACPGCSRARRLLKAIAPSLIAEYTTRHFLRIGVSGQRPVCGSGVGAGAAVGAMRPAGQGMSRASWWMRAKIQTATGKAEEEPIEELSATTTTPPVAVLGADPRRQRSTGHAPVTAVSRAARTTGWPGSGAAGCSRSSFPAILTATPVSAVTPTATPACRAGQPSRVSGRLHRCQVVDVLLPVPPRCPARRPPPLI